MVVLRLDRWTYSNVVRHAHAAFQFYGYNQNFEVVEKKGIWGEGRV